VIGDPVLVADSVAKRYGSRWVLHSAALRAHAGQVRALVGRNGVGKSTLLKVAGGLLTADSGTIRIDGTIHLTVHLAQLARQGVFFLPDHDLLSQAFTLREHLSLFGAGESDRIVSALGLDELVDARPASLSSGERRRAEVAVAWARRPRCLLADEPLRHIAPLDRELLLGVFRTMASEGCAVVLTGHEVPAIMSSVHHLTWLTAGTTYELGPPFMARNDERFIREFLGAS